MKIRGGQKKTDKKEKEGAEGLQLKAGWTDDMDIIDSRRYDREMKEKAEPFLEQRRVSGTFEATPGQKIYYEQFKAENAKATVVMLHGFSEGIYKFREMAYYFLQNGYHVWQIELRGHGKSYRTAVDPSLVHIENYQDLLKDLRHFVKQIVQPAEETQAGPLYLYAHSMGGGAGACFLERYPEYFRKAVLSSPMLELDSGNIPVWLMKAFADFMVWRKKGTDYLPGSSPYREEADFEGSCSNCLPRYRYYHAYTNDHKEYQTCAPSIQTALQLLGLTREALRKENCRRVVADVLLLQAGMDHMVKSGGQKRFIERIGKHGRLERFEDSKHEIYLSRNDQLERYVKEIMEFLG